MLKLSKIIFTILSIVFFNAGFAKADTIDFWHIYYNHKVIAELNGTLVSYEGPEKALQIRLLRKDIKNTDTLVLRYGTDTPFEETPACLYILDSQKKKFIISKSKGIWSPLSVSIQEVLDLSDHYHTNKINFYYQDNKRDVRVFYLMLK